jgi:hypothetical protein
METNSQFVKSGSVSYDPGFFRKIGDGPICSNSHFLAAISHFVFQPYINLTGGVIIC